MATDIVSLLQSLVSLSPTPIIDYIENQPFHTAGYGIIVEWTDFNLQKKGFTHQRTDAYGGDYFRIYLVADSKASRYALLQELIRIVDTWSGDSYYSQLDLNLEEIISKTHIRRQIFWFEVILYAIRNNKDLY